MKIAVLFHFDFGDLSPNVSPVKFAADFQVYLQNSMYSYTSWGSGPAPQSIAAMAAAEVPKDHP